MLYEMLLCHALVLYNSWLYRVRRPQLPAQSELSVGILAQAAVKDLVSDALVIWYVEHFGEVEVPWWISLEVDIRTKDDQQVRLLHDALFELHVNKPLLDVGRRDLMLLSHLSERLGEIYQGVATILGTDQPDDDMARCSFKFQGLWAGCRLD